MAICMGDPCDETVDCGVQRGRAAQQTGLLGPPFNSTTCDMVELPSRIDLLNAACCDSATGMC
eukprot:SAG11_NODE_28371_length_322_cov_0.932735_1_plen_62_part_10